MDLLEFHCRLLVSCGYDYGSTDSADRVNRRLTEYHEVCEKIGLPSLADCIKARTLEAARTLESEIVSKALLNMLYGKTPTAPADMMQGKTPAAPAQSSPAMTAPAMTAPAMTLPTSAAAQPVAQSLAQSMAQSPAGGFSLPPFQGPAGFQSPPIPPPPPPMDMATVQTNAAVPGHSPGQVAPGMPQMPPQLLAMLAPYLQANPAMGAPQGGSALIPHPSMPGYVINPITGWPVPAPQSGGFAPNPGAGMPGASVPMGGQGGPVLNAQGYVIGGEIKMDNR